MFAKKTLFVVGAGASAEYGLPVGSGLAAKIGDKLDVRFDDFGERQIAGDRDLYSQFAFAHRNELRDYRRASRLICEGIRLSSSIDDFLDVHNQDAHVKRVGKTAIVKTVLEAERSSDLFYDRSNIYNKLNMAKVEDTWLIKFMRMLGRGISLDKVDTIFDNVAFIVFNYDRCVEYFLHLAIQHLYSLDERRAGELMAKLTLVHPYGAIADLPYQSRSGIDFGGDSQRLTAPYLELSDRISTYTEQMEDGPILKTIRKEIGAAEKIIFLGFAFHDQNLRLLQPKRQMGPKEIYGTALGMSPSDASVAQAQLMRFFDGTTQMTQGARVHIEHQACKSLLDFYAKSLPA